MSTGRPDSSTSQEISLEPAEGWHCSHLYYAFDRGVLAQTAEADVRVARQEIIAILDPAGPDATARLQTSVVSGHKADFGLLLMDPHPLKIDAGHEQEYKDWIRWRADFVTETLRELKSRLGPIRQRTGRPLPVAVRIPSKGLFYNLAQGLDVETWCREGLIHQIQLDPLEDCGWRGEPHDVRPYLELGRRYDLPVFGGINGNTFWNYTAIMRRAQGLLEAGVAGIEIYESNNFALICPQRWIIPLLGNLPQLKAFLETSNLDACYPVWSRNAASWMRSVTSPAKAWTMMWRAVSSPIPRARR